MYKKMKSIKFIISAIFCLTLVMAHIDISFAGEQVRVGISTNKITVNDHVINNKNNKFPYITHKNITYMPMTTDDANFMGLKSDWNSNTKTLQVYKSPRTESYIPYYQSQDNVSYGTAVIPSYNIIVNQKPVDNGKQLYPLLNFRGITYFPMTWHYIVDEFGWSYVWNKQNGLVVDTTGKDIAGSSPVIPEQLPSINPMQGEFLKSFGDTTISTGITMVNHGYLSIKRNGKQDKNITLYLKDSQGNILLDKNGGKTRMYTAGVYRENNIVTALTPNATKSQISLNGNILTIVALRDIEAGDYTSDGRPNNVKLAINIETGEYTEAL